MSILGACRQYRLFSIRLATYQFSPGVLATLVTVALLYIMISLGLWQLERAEFKETLQQNIEHRKKLSAVGISELPSSIEDRRYLPVKFTGEFDVAHSFLLDNRTIKGRVGYHVFTPVKISDPENNVKSILIARGFVEMGRTREQLPEVTSPKGEIMIRGLLGLPPPTALVLADNIHQSESWPVILQYLDLPELSTMLGYELYDMVIWLNADETGTFEYDLPVLNLNATKNNGYAFQWFAMSLALLIIYIVVNTKSNK